MLQRSRMYSYIPAKDVARARQFYEQKVGLVPKMETAGGVVYEFADHTACFLYPTPNAGTSMACGTTPTTFMRFMEAAAQSLHGPHNYVRGVLGQKQASDP